MFGVGENPVYLARLAEREARKEASGEAQQEREDQRRAALIGNLFEVAEGDASVAGSGSGSGESEVTAVAAVADEATGTVDEGAEANLTAPPMPSPLMDNEITAEPEALPAEADAEEAASAAFDVLFAEPPPLWEEDE